MSFIEGGKTMAKINEPDYDLLRASVKNIIIEDNPAGKGFIINLLLKDGAQDIRGMMI